MASISNKQLAEIIYLQLQKQASEKVAKEVSKFLVQCKRTKDLSKIMRELSRLQYERDNVQEVTMTSAHKMNESVKQKILKQMNVEHYVINEVIDEDLIGGVRIESNDSIFDLSVRNRLQKLKASHR